MKSYTTNYINTLIEAAEDCPAFQAQIPPEKKEKTLANLQYEKLIKNPYQYSSDDLIFECYAIKNEISENEKENEREKFFSKANPVSVVLLWQKNMDLDFIIIQKEKLPWLP